MCVSACTYAYMYVLVRTCEGASFTVRFEGSLNGSAPKIQVLSLYYT